MSGKYRKIHKLHKYNSEKANKAKYSKTKLPWFNRLLQHSARKRGGLIPQCSWAHTGPKAYHGKLYNMLLNIQLAVDVQSIKYQSLVNIFTATTRQ